MALPCSDTVALIQPYLDGELVERPLHDFESHIAGCPECADSLRAQEAFCRHVRTGVRPVQHGPELHRRIELALDAEDVVRTRARRRARAVRLVPFGVAAAAAAALTVLATQCLRADRGDRGGESSPAGIQARADGADDPVCITAPPTAAFGADDADDDVAVADPGEPLDPDRLARRAASYVGMPVALPSFRDTRVTLRVLQLARVRDRRAAMLLYDVETPRARRLLWIYLFDARGLPPREAGEPRTVNGHRVWVTHKGGYPVVIHRSARQVEYVFQANMSRRSLIELVAGSGLLLL